MTDLFHPAVLVAAICCGTALAAYRSWLKSQDRDDSFGPIADAPGCACGHLAVFHSKSFGCEAKGDNCYGHCRCTRTHEQVAA